MTEHEKDNLKKVELFGEGITKPANIFNVGAVNGYGPYIFVDRLIEDLYAGAYDHSEFVDDYLDYVPKEEMENINFGTM